MKTKGEQWLGGIASILSSAVAAIACPACIPALGALLASAGLGFALSTRFMHALLVALLAVSVGSLAWAARAHRRWSVLTLGVVGAGLIYGGRHAWSNPLLMWTGAAMLIGASLLNLRVKRACCQCGQGETNLERKGNGNEGCNRPAQ